MPHYKVEIVGEETLIVEAADSLDADETARRQTSAKSPLTTYITETDADPTSPPGGQR
jgi:hypothetical protein